VAERRRYTKRQKAGVVTAALASSVTAAADQTGVPRTTIQYWMDAPEFVQLRQKTREDLAEESRVLAHKALGEITRRIGEFEPRDLAILYGVLTDKAQLLAGQATARTEHRELSDELDDHEREALTRILREAVEKVEA
jgi:tetrahydromethanopterin S-methyltransferase subunit G